MKIIKYSAIALLVILLVLFIDGKINGADTIMIGGQSVSLNKPWKKLPEAKRRLYQNLIVSYQFADCSDLYSKEIDNETIILACFTTQKKWTFYHLFLKSNDLMRLSNEVSEKIDPPK